jgi:hypothetical protein
VTLLTLLSFSKKWRGGDSWEEGLKGTQPSLRMILKDVSSSQDEFSLKGLGGLWGEEPSQILQGNGMNLL